MDGNTEDQLNRIKWMLHDGLFDDTEWKRAGLDERVEWLLSRIEATRGRQVEDQLLEIIEQLNDTQDRSERYREELVAVQYSKDIVNAHEIARNALNRA
jgi:hypothetical protein